MKKKTSKGKAPYICAFFSVIFALGALQAESWDSRLIGTAAAVGLAIPLGKKVYASVHKKKAAATKSVCPAPAVVKEEPKIPPYCFIRFRAKGTSYTNDEGEDRQFLLRKMKFRDEPFDGDSWDVELKPYDYTDEDTGETSPAIKILVNGHDVGRVPRESVAEVMEAMGKPGCMVSAVDVLGGGKKENGERLHYGFQVVVRYNNPAAERPALTLPNP